MNRPSIPKQLRFQVETFEIGFVLLYVNSRASTSEGTLEILLGAHESMKAMSTFGGEDAALFFIMQIQKLNFECVGKAIGSLTSLK